MNRWTQLVQFDPCPGDHFHSNSTPIYQTATFAQSLDRDCLYDYSRSKNPTRSIVEQQIAKLEGGDYAFAFNSGMAALVAIIGLIQCGDHIIAGDDLYGGTYRLLSQRLAGRGIDFTLVDTTDLQAVAKAITPKTRLILIETPSNPLQKISSIHSLADLAHNNNALLVIDNTFLSPWLQQPLLLGADIVLHSATKHLSGHSDVTAGVIVTNKSDLAAKLAFIQNAEGAALAPFECWLLLRGLKTLGLRIEREQDTAIKIAHYLKDHPAVKNIYYPGLNNHPGHTIHQKQALGPGSVISFETESYDFAKRFVANTQLFILSVSFGSLNSLISLPCQMSHAPVPTNECGLTNNLIRLSIGIEDADDLIGDLHQAFIKCSKQT